MTDTVPAEVMARLDAHEALCVQAGAEDSRSRPGMAKLMASRNALVAAIAKALDAAKIDATRANCEHHWWDHLDGTGHCTKCGQKSDGNGLLP